MEKPDFIHKKEEYIDRVAKSNTDIRLLARHNSLEVMKQKIAKGATFYLDSAEDWQGFEFIYLIKGELEYMNSDPRILIEPGDYISRKGVPEESWFETKSDVVLLYTSSQPAFHLLREEIEDYLKLAQEVESTEQMDGHSKRLVRMSFEVGKRLGLSTDKLGYLKYAAFFHDIGKARVPDRLLEKKGELTDEEWEIMEQHTKWGREMLEGTDHLEEVGKIVEQTHERVDGEGYPKGLEGDEISLAAKIVSVVDAWDAMRTDRPYRDALPKEVAIAELEENKGSQFAPEVVDTFLNVLQGKDSIEANLDDRAKYKEEVTRLKRREELFRLTKTISSAGELEEIMENLLEAVIEATPFQRAIVSIFDKPVSIPPDESESVHVKNYDHRGLREEQVKRIADKKMVGVEVDLKKFDPRYRVGESYYVPHGERKKQLDDEARIESQLRQEETLDWHPDDALYVPITSGDKLLGQISVDDPEDGLVPEPENLHPMETFASLAGLAIEKLLLEENSASRRTSSKLN